MIGETSGSVSPNVGSERVVLARRIQGAFVPFQWTGAEPEGLDDIDLARALGSTWEGDELVTYNLNALIHQYANIDHEFHQDPD